MERPYLDGGEDAGPAPGSQTLAGRPLNTTSRCTNRDSSCARLAGMIGCEPASNLVKKNDAIDFPSRFCSTLAMRFRLHRALLALVFALSFILNGSAMQLAHSAMPDMSAADAEKHHPCCPRQNQNKASCTADCCTSVIPVMVQAGTQFTFVQYRQRPSPVLVLSSRIPAPPSRPPQV
jgi:hypothetical protein